MSPSSPPSSHAAPAEAYRTLAPRVLAAIVRKYGDFGEAEDAVQEALLAAATQWPDQGRPDDPGAWLITVAARRLIDRRRSDMARARREVAAASLVPDHALLAPGADVTVVDPDHTDDAEDDTLTLLLLCCHPAVTAPSQIALTLRAVGGLTTAEIAAAFLVPESTMGQRISRAKKQIAQAGARFAPPPDSERAERMRAVLHVLYLIFNEGYTSSSGSVLHRVELTTEAIRLARHALALLPDDGEVAGLLALMLLTEARRPARMGADGALIPLAEQNRDLWDRSMIDEGVALISSTLATSALGPYQLQAAIAAIHDEAPTVGDTDWQQILVLYRMVQRLAPNPVVTVNQAVAVAMVHGPGAGLELLDTLETEKALARHHRVPAVRGHLLELAGNNDAARESYLLAAQLTTSLPEKRYLVERAERLP